MMNRRREMLLKKSGGGRLPKEYQEVEYIYKKPNDKTTHLLINKNVFINYYSTRLEVDASYTDNSQVIVNGNNELGHRFVIGKDANKFYFGTGDYNNYITNTDSQRHTLFIDSSNGTFGYDDVIQSVSFGTKLNYTEFFVFKRSYKEQNPWGWQQIFYSAKLFNNGNLDVYLIPCYRKSDEMVGVYDIVNEVFYESQGEGILLKGDDI